MELASPEPRMVDRLRRELARGTGDLPVLGPAAERALELARARDFEVRDVVQLAEHHGPFAARLMAVANSALYYRGVTISSLPLAVARLGVQAVRDVLYQCVYSAALFDAPGYRDLVSDTFRHGALVAHLCRAIAPRVRLDADTAFLAGLLHDIGRARCLKLAARWARTDADRAESLAAIDLVHARAGAELAGAWKLPDPIVEACAHHHEPEERSWARLVHVADRVAHGVKMGEDAAIDVLTAEAANEDAELALIAIGLDPAELDALVAIADRRALALG